MPRLAAVLVLALAALLPRLALADAGRLAAALDMPGVLAVMRAEGLDYAAALDRDMMQGRGGPGWQAAVSEIYDTDRLAGIVMPRFSDALAGQDTAEMARFFESPLGRRIVRLEISAREAFLEEAVEEAAQLSVQQMAEDEDPRLRRIEAFIEAGDLIEANVAGGLNSSLAFWQGLGAGGFLAREMTEEDILAEVWGQEPQIRADTEEWVWSYLALAYEPLSDDELEAYVAFARTPAGTAMNRALFAAFDAMFADISYRLGFGVARELAGQEL